MRSGGPGSFVFGDEEKKEVMDVLESGYLFRYGKDDDVRFKHKVADFEQAMAELLDVGQVVATSSGTGALLCCLAALGIGAGDEVIVPGYTFIASISSILVANATPVLAEVDDSLVLDPTKIEAKIGPKTKAIMPVHMLGNPCRMDEIMKIAKKHGLYVIEDCCQAFGARYKGKAVGSWGDIAAFSLNVFKTINSGDGGAVCSKDPFLYERAFAYHDQGHKPYRHGVEVGNRSMFGMNMRMNELSGAVSLAQIRKLDAILTKLRSQKSMLKTKLKDLPNCSFRTINDEEGECATLLTLLFDTADLADRFCEQVGSKTISHSGWHVYNNMEQLLTKKMAATNNFPFTSTEYPFSQNYEANMLPITDDLLQRAVNISVGVVDAGLGSGFGININSTEEEILNVARNIRETCQGLS